MNFTEIINKKDLYYKGVIQTWVECNFTKTRNGYEYNYYDLNNKIIYAPSAFTFLKVNAFRKDEIQPVDLIILISMEAGRHLQYLSQQLLLKEINIEIEED